ncbi:MAG TPA: hypothetical protein VH415_17095 [Nitrososphaeraceae archaeon]|jgi:hypothetical protein
MNSNIDHLHLKKGVKEAIKSVGKNLGKLPEIKGAESKLDDSKPNIAGIVWENRNHQNTNENSGQNLDSSLPNPIEVQDKDVALDNKSDFEINTLERTTIFSNKVSMWIS